MTYNLSFMDTNNTLFEFAESVNQVAGGWFFGLMLFILFVILMIAMKHYSTKISFLVSSFICAVVGIMLMFMGFVGLSVIIYFIIGAVGSIIFYYFSED